MNHLPLFAGVSEATPEAKNAPKPLTVTELTMRIRGVLEPALTQVWVQGEVSNYRPAPSGHAYFSLNDQGSAVAVAFFGWGARQKGKQSFELKDGLQVLCRGKISVYPPRGTYQLVLDRIEPLGAGALQVAFEQLKLKLAAEGLFDHARKKAIPKFPCRLAIVTSPSGAAIHDILNVLKRRAPHVQVLVIPALVQGEGAHARIIRGLEVANQYRLGDVVLLTRGGGSIEDLWCFNHESLARAIAQSELPVVSAVGHEIDFTIADFVADLRAPTPSAAAEILSSAWAEAASRSRDLAGRLRSSMVRDLANRKAVFSHLAARVVSPKDRLREQIQRTDEWMLRLERAMKTRLERRRNVLQRYMSQLDALSPLRVLERGYTIVRCQDEGPDKQNAHVIKSAQQLQSGGEYQITFHDGQRVVRAL